ncbi:hypothetical protein CDD80_2666 [Ophiocordyceps camponoti-rufipedis]|uniref:Uncharacterized protein n=1 Tax=Ophiocordyceps camponoti-rufipedis TaxID=2004952 RepID=A0A2C5XJY5_9HYPO|nr:hypothetical protein CDD80_2666 [Ophiocordyceps camponoti-rufipedis]
MATSGSRGSPKKSSTKSDIMQGINRMTANYRSATRTGRFSGMGLDLHSHAKYNTLIGDSQPSTPTEKQKPQKKGFFSRFRIHGGSESPKKLFGKGKGNINSKPWRSMVQEDKPSPLPQIRSSVSYDSLSSRRRLSSSSSDESIDTAGPPLGSRRGSGQRETRRRASRQGLGVKSPSWQSPSYDWRPTAPKSSPGTPLNPGISAWPADRKLPSPEAGPPPYSGLYVELPSTSGQSTFGRRRGAIYNPD